MEDLEICKRIAEIEGFTLTYSDNLGEWSIGTPYEKDDRPYNPLTNKALLFDLMVKYKVCLENYEAIHYASIKNNVKRVDNESDIPRAILTAIIEANSNR